MQIATTQKVVNALSPARRVPDMRRAAVNTNVTANPVRPLYQRLHRPTSSRTRPAATPVAAKQIKPAPRVLASRTITTASAPRVPKILARARADYKQNADSKIGKTRIPRPMITAVKEASVRRQSRLWARMTSVVIRRKITVLAAETTTEAEDDEEELYVEAEKPTMEFEEPASEIIESADDDMDNTSLMFNDNSFDDSVSPEQQTSAMNLFGRKMVSMKRLGMGLRTNRDWFVGLSRCPDYTGDSVGLERVRSRTTVTTESHLTQDASEGAFVERPHSAKAPASQLPVVKPKSVVVSQKTTKRQMTTSKTTSTSSSNRDATASKPRKPVAPVAALRKTPNKPTTVAKSLPKQNLAPVSLSKRRVSRANTKRSARKPDARASRKAKTVLKSAMRKPNSQAVKKHVCYVEGPIAPRFYDVEETVKQSATAVDGSTASFPWEPLTGLLHTQPPSPGRGATQLFEGSDSGALTIKRRFLNRYASVQRYEARRREEALARSERPALGQLDYGNADFRIALQASNVITADDVGMMQDLSNIGKAGKLWCGNRAMATPVLVFGKFKEPFHNAAIPAKGVKAYKKPLRWPTTGVEARLEKFADEHLKCLQAADSVI
ncbi:hypothetical protein J4E93_009985 [Alternaria ventricosa]|uniref:uncharacterized protein n=1 Tax=Alternaria ventricosa TaxID=1187951 RepID=UPI0020C477DC|nr:uncharacterized protein J4E93_009985 [Alternaria ventricosa]KAI4638432.1 hypothetical protein J4E93_009985 [Alternaria ventricosa]